MTIPGNSDILIEGVNPANLALAVLLSKNGAKVLLVDENPAISPFNPIVLDEYCFNFLIEYGFSFTDGEKKEFTIQSDSFAKQSFKILGTNLCSIIWGVNFNNNTSTWNEYMLQHDGKFSIHQTKYLVSQLHSKSENNLSDFSNAFLLAWRLLGVFVRENLDRALLTSYFSESIILQNQFTLKEKGKSKQSTWLKILRLKEKDYNLIESKTNLHLSMYRNLQAGELVPNISFFDEKAKEYITLHKWCNYKYFSVIIFGSINQPNLFSLARWIQLNYSVQLFYLPWSKRNQEIFTELKILEGAKKTLIVRPDKYIGLLQDGIDIDIIDNYLANFIHMKEKVKPKED
jgi:hypothetical protein